MGRRKKIRGGKHHLQRIEKLSVTPAPMSMQSVLERYCDYTYLGLAPWHWHHRQPPLRIRQLTVQHLLITFDSWLEQLAAYPDPLYAAVWVVQSEFAHSSKVVVAAQDRIDHYENWAKEPVADGPPLPKEYQHLPGVELFSWTTHRWEILLDQFGFSGTWPAWALAKPHYLYTHDDGEVYLVVQTGWLWVGQRPQSPLT